MMHLLTDIRRGERGIVVAGNHLPIIQSVFDFDFLSGKPPSVLAIVTGARTAEKFFFGRKEILIPCVPDFGSIPQKRMKEVRFLLNLQSGRRVLESTTAFFRAFPSALGAHVFAENVPEAHAVELASRYGGKKWLFGPSGVGLLVGGHLKLGAAGGISPLQIAGNHLTTEGSVAVVSTSGGMTNELIHGVVEAGKRLSFAACIGGDRFPVASLSDVLLLAEADTQTKMVAYFGELGGEDEYEIVRIINEKRLTKPVVAYIAGVIDEAFDEHVQFGHAKALVARPDESARAKRKALAEVGVNVSETFPAFLASLAEATSRPYKDVMNDTHDLSSRRASILSTRSIDVADPLPASIRGKKLVRSGRTFSDAIIEALLNRRLKSATTKAFFETIFTLLIDHGGAVSGAVNAMITARAGKDLPSSLAAGLLTIGPRFGGAVSDAARTWIAGVASGKDAASFVSERTKTGALLAGIGHRKYRVGLPDPRVATLASFAMLLKGHTHYDFARAVEKITTTKNGKLILNIDGIIAALALDVLAECEKLSVQELHTLANAEFFNALFIIPRIVGFSAHVMEQKENDEGLFRLPEELLFVRDTKNKSSTAVGEKIKRVR